MEVYQKNREAIIKEIQEAKKCYNLFNKDVLREELKSLYREASQKVKAVSKARNAVEVEQTVLARKLKILEIAENEHFGILGRIGAVQEALNR